MKTFLILLYSFVLFVSALKVIFGYTTWLIAIGIAFVTFVFIDWDNMPWFKLRFRY